MFNIQIRKILNIVDVLLYFVNVFEFEFGNLIFKIRIFLNTVDILK